MHSDAAYDHTTRFGVLDRDTEAAQHCERSETVFAFEETRYARAPLADCSKQQGTMRNGLVTRNDNPTGDVTAGVCAESIAHARIR